MPAVPDARRSLGFARVRPKALVAYYRDCVDAECRTDVVYDARHPSIALMTEGNEPVVSINPASAVPLRGSAALWAARQLTSGSAETISCGYPLAVGRRAGRLVLAPVFSRECRLEWDGTGVAVRATGARPETNEHALAMLGWDPDARALWLEEVAGVPLRSFDDALERASRLVGLGDIGLGDIGLVGVDPRHLGPLPTVGARPAIANTALLYAAEPANTSRGVLSELEQLRSANPSGLRRGPLGIVLGYEQPPCPPRDHPVPIVLPSNVAQDRAVSASLRSPLTVVTGPPGTGKSQVLVNAVAATVIAGQTVLIASRTNRAVDVVFERLQDLPGGIPIRAGRAALRAGAAEQIRSSLSAASGGVGGAGGARGAWAAWAALASALEPIHQEVAARELVYDRWLAARDRADRMASPWGWDLSGAAPATVRAEAHARTEATRAAARLARLPPQEALSARLAGFEARRLGTGRELWRAAWAGLGGHAPDRARAGAAALARRLEAGPVGADDRSGLAAFPVWGLTNLAAAACLPLALDLFDLVIMDEASQCDIASALPLLARARRALIIGDSRQLAHVSRLSAEREQALARRHRIPAADLSLTSQRQRSLYDVAAARLGRPPLLLDEHYRCHPRIIGFSNERLYSGRLTVRTSSAPGGGLFWRDVAGSFRRGPDGRSAMNPEEAVAVVDQLMTERRANPGATIGVVAPFRAQADLIRQLANQSSQPGRAELAAITIDTVHRFQGDERDVMLLSPTVAGPMPGFFRRVAGRPRLLNVAVTRARHRLVVVGDAGACLATGGMLAELAAYATPLTEEPDHVSPAGDRRRSRQAPRPRS